MASSKNGEHRACGEEEQLYEAHGICGEAQTRVNKMALRRGCLFSLCVRRDDKVGKGKIISITFGKCFTSNKLAANKKPITPQTMTGTVEQATKITA